MVTRENAAMLESRPELSATFAGEMRLLRAVVGMVIAEMVERVR